MPALPLHAQARLVGSYQWLERRLFEVLGSWVASEPVPEAQMLFDVYSQQHAWHAELFAERLPALDSVDPDSLVLPPSAEVDRMCAVLAGAVPAGDGTSTGDGVIGPGDGSAVPAGGTLPRLVGVGRVVLPRLLTGYKLHLRRVCRGRRRAHGPVPPVGAARRDRAVAGARGADPGAAAPSPRRRRRHRPSTAPRGDGRREPVPAWCRGPTGPDVWRWGPEPPRCSPSRHAGSDDVGADRSRPPGVLRTRPLAVSREEIGGLGS